MLSNTILMGLMMFAKRRRHSSSHSSSSVDPAIIGLIAILIAITIVVVIVVCIVKSVKKRAKKRKAEEGFVPSNQGINIDIPQPKPVIQGMDPSAGRIILKLTEEKSGVVYEVSLSSQVTIGRSGCTINITDDSSISGTHCQIYTYESNFVLADMNSTNGTRLNNYKLNTPVFIESGNILGIGKKRFRVTFEKAE